MIFSENLLFCSFRPSRCLRGTGEEAAAPAGLRLFRGIFRKKACFRRFSSSFL
jgi:hypothetical protein